jgi:hypothetical protein
MQSPKFAGRQPKSDHFIVGIPIAKGIIGCVNQYQSAAFSDKFNSRFLGFLSPFPVRYS